MKQKGVEGRRMTQFSFSPPKKINKDILDAPKGKERENKTAKATVKRLEIDMYQYYCSSTYCTQYA